LALVVDASMGLKWVLEEPGSHLAQALIRIGPDSLVPDFRLNEATNVLWLQVRRKLLSPDEARDGLALLRAQVEPTPTAHMRLHEAALEIGIATNHSTDDTSLGNILGRKLGLLTEPGLRTNIERDRRLVF
jgi:predicted nucleic acid-binding protein